MNGKDSFIIEVCQQSFRKKNHIESKHNEKSLIPTIIAYSLFILMDILTFLWIHISYRDICYLKRKRLATVFFYSFVSFIFYNYFQVFTKFQNYERSTMVNCSLKRLFSICLLVISNIIATLPILTIQIFDISLNLYQRILFIYLTTLPWIDCIAFSFYNETKFNKIIFSPKKIKIVSNDYCTRQQRIGRRLSSYKQNTIGIQNI